jgi:nucleotidyltransferase substrate binding protein (TIGR01987 family)
MNDTASLDFSNLQDAITQMKESLFFLESELAKDQRLYAQFRSAAIQAFEYSYELAHKSLKRFLQTTMPSAEIIAGMSFPELIRTGYEQGLLKNSWSIWKEYRDARNASSHAYSGQVADEVLTKIPAFLEEALYLHRKLDTKKNA